MKQRSSKAGLFVLVAAVAVLVVSLAYAWQRDRPAATVAGPIIPGPPTIETLQERAQTAPDDAGAWAALGSARFDRREFAAAEQAYARATALADDRSDLWSALGEARVMASPRDPMPPAALAAFRKALTLDPRDARGRYFVAVQRDLTGDHVGAIADWLALLKDSPPGAPWIADLRRTIEQVGKINKIDVAPRLAAIAPNEAHRGMFTGSTDGAVAGIPGPTPEQMRAATALPQGERSAMIDGMVASLEAKLAANPSDLDRWEMLMRSRMTLNQPTKAAAALRSAVAANPSARARLEATATALGVPAA